MFQFLERDAATPDPRRTINEGFRSEIFPRFLDRGFIVTFDRRRESERVVRAAQISRRR